MVKKLTRRNARGRKFLICVDGEQSPSMFNPRSISLQVAEIFFHNFYTAWITVLVRSQPSTDSGLSGPGSSVVCSVMSSSASREAPWQMAIPRRNLMTNPHLESGSHDFISILATEVRLLIDPCGNTLRNSSGLSFKKKKKK